MPRTIAFFGGATPATGTELWDTDGTASGTVPVRDIVPGATGSYPGSSGFAAAGAGAVVFAAEDGGVNGPELFVSNGTAAGTAELSNAFIKVPYPFVHIAGAYVDPLGSFTPLGNGRVLFLGATNTSTLQLWSTDSTVAGTKLVKDLTGISPTQPVPIITAIGNGRAVFTVTPSAIAGAQGVYGTDGTSAGTVQLSTAASVLGSLGDGRALLSQPGRTGSTLQVTDGTVAGTVALRGFLAGSIATATGIGSGRALFSASDGLAGQELWLTDGTAAGTVKLLQGPAIGPNSPSGLNPVNITPLGNGLIAFTGNDGTVRNALYVTDGTAAGTVALAEIGPAGSTSYSVGTATSLGNGRAVYRVVDSATDDTALYVADGTPAGTGVAHYFASTSLGGSPYPALVGNTVTLPNGTAVFSVNDGSTNFQVWRTDGTAAGTYEIAAVAQAGYGTPQFTALPDGRAVFRVSNGDDTFTLWATSGTAASTAAIPGVSVSSTSTGASFGVATVADLDPLFDTDYYNARNADVAAGGLNAWQHYLTNGGTEGRSPDPFFDGTLYLLQNPDVAASGMNPLLHFEAYGWHEGRDPSLLFSDTKYLAANPDVAASGMDPLAHYFLYGQVEGRATFLSGGVETADPLVSAPFYDAQLGASLIPTGTAAAQQAAWSYDTGGWQRGLKPDSLFDTTYYLQHNPDVATAHVNPLLQYEQFGWKEGRDPSAAFSTSKYLAANPDVAAAGIDPLLHYVQYGQAEGRAIYPA